MTANPFTHTETMGCANNIWVRQHSLSSVYKQHQFTHPKMKEKEKKKKKKNHSPLVVLWEGVA